MNDRTPNAASGHLSATERARLARYDQTLDRLWYTGAAALYLAGILASVALLKEITQEDGPMAAVYLGVALALFGAGEKVRRAATQRRNSRQ
ncbi:hypothetical protein [Streptomyces sp. NPDC086835]|uniref:hypothetical protein n=1 Tax=Streptomyces sp. NPDC086835 TaxID=3365761 RepID=UPI00381F8953